MTCFNTKTKSVDDLWTFYLVKQNPVLPAINQMQVTFHASVNFSNLCHFPFIKQKQPNGFCIDSLKMQGGLLCYREDFFQRQVGRIAEACSSLCAAAKRCGDYSWSSRYWKNYDSDRNHTAGCETRPQGWQNELCFSLEFHLKNVMADFGLTRTLVLTSPGVDMCSVKHRRGQLGGETVTIQDKNGASGTPGATSPADSALLTRRHRCGQRRNASREDCAHRDEPSTGKIPCETL